jgi:hypothetical protein
MDLKVFIENLNQVEEDHQTTRTAGTQLELILQENEFMAEKLSQTWFDEWNMIQNNVFKKTKLNFVSPVWS